VVAFLSGALTSGRVSASQLEARARAAGLLAEHQHITHSKPFKRAKKALGIRSLRNGFGRDGEWFWSLPEQPSPQRMPPVSNGLGPPIAEAPIEATNANDHSWPRGSLSVEPTPASGSPTELTISIPQEWIQGVARLNAHRAPADVPLHRWRQFCDDCKNFLTSRENWAQRAAELGWTAESLFGCPVKRPLDHLSGAGLLWLLNGGRFQALHEDWAVIFANGAERIFHRRPNSPNVVLPWRLR